MCMAGTFSPPLFMGLRDTQRGRHGQGVDQEKHGLGSLSFGTPPFQENYSFSSRACRVVFRISLTSSESFSLPHTAAVFKIPKLKARCMHGS